MDGADLANPQEPQAAPTTIWRDVIECIAKGVVAASILLYAVCPVFRALCVTVFGLISEQLGRDILEKLREDWGVPL